LAIVDSPAPGSTENAGSSLVIAIDLSGDGIIPQSAFIPGSGLPTRYDSLELYLLSSQREINLTVSSGPGLLNQESGSTVKHLEWPMPDCLSPGSYNLTIYEGSHIGNNAFFSITPIPITIANAKVDSNKTLCSSNTLQQQPQQDSAPAENPYNNPDSGVNADNSASSTAPPGTITVTVGPSGFPTIWSIESSGFSTATTPVNGVTTVTVIAVSEEVLTETTTDQGRTELVTTTVLSTTTLTAVMPSTAVPSAGFLPVNGAFPVGSRAYSAVLTLCLCIPLWVLVFAF